MTPVQVLLVRHCASAGQDPDAPLTADGRAQAERLAEWLARFPVDHVISSPYARARATIEPFALQAGLPVHLEERLAERRLAPEPMADWRRVVRQSFADLDYQVPGGESGRATLTRGRAAIQDALALGCRLPVIVSHGQLLSLVLHAIDPAFAFERWESLSNPDVYLLSAEPDARFSFRRVWERSDQ